MKGGASPLRNRCQFCCSECNQINNNKLVSETGSINLELTNYGNLELYSYSRSGIMNKRNLIWSTDIKPVPSTGPFNAIMLKEGDLAIYDKSEKMIWNTDISSDEKEGSYLIVKDNCQMNIVSRFGKSIWVPKLANGSKIKDCSSLRITQLALGKCLNSDNPPRGGSTIYSPNGTVKLSILTTGNLVLSNTNGKLWESSSSSGGEHPFRAKLDTNGKFYIYDSNGSIVTILYAGTADKFNGYLEVTNDCVAQIYNNGTILWKTPSNCNPPYPDKFVCKPGPVVDRTVGPVQSTCVNWKDLNISGDNNGIPYGYNTKEECLKAGCYTTWDQACTKNWQLASAEQSFNTLDIKNTPSQIMRKYCGCQACVPPEDPGKAPSWTKDKNGSSSVSCKDGTAYPYGHMCPRVLLGSSLMIDAAKNDFKGSDYLPTYAVVGHDPTWSQNCMDQAGSPAQLAACYLGYNLDKYKNSSGELVQLKQGQVCGQCYEMEFLPLVDLNTKEIIIDEITGKQIVPNPIISQSFNTAAPSGTDVFNFDIYQSNGGYGAFCSVIDTPKFSNNTVSGSFLYKDQAKTSQGNYYGNSQTQAGGCRGSMGMPAVNIPMLNGCMDSDSKNYCIKGKDQIDLDDPTIPIYNSDLDDIYTSIKGNTDGATELARESLLFSYKNHYHWNLGIKRIRRVLCPNNLTKVTGLTRKSTDPALVGLPDPITDRNTGWIDSYISNDPKTDGLYDPNKWIYGTTTMEDGCKPTCSQDESSGGTDTKDGATPMFTCDQNGFIFIDKDD
jgi:hypothetical protein